MSVKIILPNIIIVVFSEMYSSILKYFQNIFKRKQKNPIGTPLFVFVKQKMKKKGKKGKNFGKIGAGYLQRYSNDV